MSRVTASVPTAPNRPVLVTVGRQHPRTTAKGDHGSAPGVDRGARRWSRGNRRPRVHGARPCTTATRTACCTNGSARPPRCSAPRSRTFRHRSRRGQFSPKPTHADRGALTSLMKPLTTGRPFVSVSVWPAHARRSAAAGRRRIQPGVGEPPGARRFGPSSRRRPRRRSCRCSTCSERRRVVSDMRSASGRARVCRLRGGRAAAKPSGQRRLQRRVLGSRLRHLSRLDRGRGSAARLRAWSTRGSVAERHGTTCHSEIRRCAS